MKLLLALGVLTQIFTGSLALAGVASSGGGHIFKNAHNPWFLKNVKTVTYCIRLDDKVFKDLPHSPQEMVKTAIAYWKNEFSRVPLFNNPWGKVEIATQTFVERACTGQEDLVFQFGVIDDAQKQNYLADPTSVVGFPMRTEYDEVNLKGKGFIYISADAGPLRYRGDHLIDRAWHIGQGGLLYRAIAHELGHVFGLPHHGNGLMAEDYPERLINGSMLPALTAQNMINSLELPGYFTYRPVTYAEEQCVQFPKGLAGLNVFFGTHDLVNSCLRIRSIANSSSLSLTASPWESPTEARIGEITLSDEADGPIQLGWGVHLFVTPAQNVFELGNLTAWLWATNATAIQKGGQLISISNPKAAPIPILEVSHPDHLLISGVFDGKMIPSLFTREQWE